MKDLSEALKSDIRGSAVIARLGASIGGYAVCCDNDMSSINAYAATTEWLASRGRGHFFEPPFWPHEDADGLQVSGDMLYTSYEELADKSDGELLYRHIEDSFRVVNEALYDLRMEGFFKADVVVFCTTNDPIGRLLKLEGGSVQRLNGAAVSERWRCWAAGRPV